MRGFAAILIGAALGGAGLAACGGGPERPILVAATPVPPPVVGRAVEGPLLNADGTCDGPVPGGASAIAPGIGECEIVRLKGKPPTDVLVGEGGGGREVQVLYGEPGGRELYFFVDGRLARIVK